MAFAKNITSRDCGRLLEYATDGSTALGTPSRQATPQEETSFDEASVSQGTFGAQAVPTAVLWAAADMAEEERLPDYSQVVDNDTKGRFRAVGWQERSGSYSYGGDYAYAESGTETRAARFKVNVPTAGDYAVYAWWHAAKANSASARFGVSTAFGTKWTSVNQQREGGMWVKLGTYELEAGDRYAVRLSPEGGSGHVVANAVAIVRGAASPPPDGEQRPAQPPRHSPGGERSHRHPLQALASTPLPGVQNGGLLLPHQVGLQDV